jgi:hypothetical protein
MVKDGFWTMVNTGEMAKVLGVSNMSKAVFSKLSLSVLTKGREG